MGWISEHLLVLKERSKKQCIHMKDNIWLFRFGHSQPSISALSASADSTNG